MEKKEIQNSRHQSRQSESLISPDFKIPELNIKAKDKKLSKKGTNVFVRFRPDNYREKFEVTKCVEYFPDRKTITIEKNSFKFRRIFPGEITVVCWPMDKLAQARPIHSLATVSTKQIR